MKTPNESFWAGVCISLCVGIPLGVLVYSATTWMWWFLQTAAAIVVGGGVARTLFVKGYQSIVIPEYHFGVATWMGKQSTTTLYSAGKHWGFPGFSAALPVDMRHQKIDLVGKFSASASDTEDVGTDGFLLVRARNPFKASNVKDVGDSIREVFESRIRLFTSLVLTAAKAVSLRDLLADYLELEPRTTDVLPPVHQAFKDRLEGLSGCIVPGGVDTLMQKDTAGALKHLLGVWGYEIEEVEIEQFDVPEEVKKANIQRATAATIMTAEMEAKKIQSAARRDMVNELVAAGVNANTAMNSVDMLLGLNVTKTVEEITLTDLDKMMEKISGPIAGILQQYVARRGRNRPKPQQQRT